MVFEGIEPFGKGGGVAVAEVAQPTRVVVAIPGGEPRAVEPPVTLLLAKKRVKDSAHCLPVRIECGAKSGPVGVTHRFGKELLPFGLFRQVVGLSVLPILEPVLDPAEKDVRLVERLLSLLGEDSPFGEPLQHRAGGANSQRRVASAPDQLMDLGNKFDFANAPRPQFHVVLTIFPRHFAADLCVEIPHRFDRAEVEVFAKDERLG